MPFSMSNISVRLYEVQGLFICVSRGIYISSLYTSTEQNIMCHPLNTLMEQRADGLSGTFASLVPGSGQNGQTNCPPV